MWQEAEAKGENPDDIKMNPLSEAIVENSLARYQEAYQSKFPKLQQSEAELQRMEGRKGLYEKHGFGSLHTQFVREATEDRDKVKRPFGEKG